MEEETIQVISSDEGGNGFPPEAPSEIIEETPVVIEEPEEKLYELPDGRKVDADTLSKEWKENFYPDYTRKSQALAAKDSQQPIVQNNQTTNPIEDPNWIPSSYGEIVKIAKEEVRKDLEREQQEKSQKQQEIETNVANEIAEIKKVDPTVNIDSVFVHANKYGFNSLPLAHQNMRDMADMAKNVQQTTVKNIAKRSDPVSVSTGTSGGVKPDPSHFSSASDYLKAIQ